MTAPNGGQPSYAPAWYADVTAPGTERCFDGAAWTEDVRPAEMQTVQLTGAGADRGYVAPAAGSYPAPAVEADAYATVAAGLGTAGVATAGLNRDDKEPWCKRKPIIIPDAIVGGIIVLSGIGSAMGGGSAAPPQQTSRRPRRCQKRRKRPRKKSR